MGIHSKELNKVSNVLTYQRYVNGFSGMSQTNKDALVSKFKDLSETDQEIEIASLISKSRKAIQHKQVTGSQIKTK